MSQIYDDDSEVQISGISHALLAEMRADLDDGIRCEEELSEAELDRLAAADRADRALVLGKIDPTTAGAFRELVTARHGRCDFLEVLLDGTVVIPRAPAYVAPGELADLKAYVSEHNATPHDETRVSVAGRRFKAEARLAGGRWVKAKGTFATEPEAWAAASAKLADLAKARPNTTEAA